MLFMLEMCCFSLEFGRLNLVCILSFILMGEICMCGCFCLLKFHHYHVILGTEVFEGTMLPWCMQDETHSTQISVSQDLYCSASLASDHSANVADRFEDDQSFSLLGLFFWSLHSLFNLSLRHKLL